MLCFRQKSACLPNSELRVPPLQLALEWMHSSLSDELPDAWSSYPQPVLCIAENVHPGYSNGRIAEHVNHP